MKSKALRRAAEKWLAHFDEVPASVLEKVALSDGTMLTYESDSLRLVAGPEILCGLCLQSYEGRESFTELLRLDELDLSEACKNCASDLGWILKEPSTFPCGWGTLFAPPAADRRWFIDNPDAVSKLGFYVFESEDYGVLLGIDAAGFDFYEAYWIPLYELRQGRS